MGAFDRKGFQGTARTSKRIREAPEGAGESGQLSFAVGSHRGTPNQATVACQPARQGVPTIPLGSLKGGTDEWVTDQG
jgi:hypothetical protein